MFFPLLQVATVNPPPPMNNEALQDDVQISIVNLFKDHIGVLILAILAIVVIVLILYSAISKIVDLIGNKIFKNNEYIEFGKLRIKNKTKEGKMLNNTRLIDINSFINMLDILLTNTIDNAISKTIETTNSINNIEKDYVNSCSNIFRAVYTDIGNAYYHGLINYACKKINMDLSKIHNTREYFFIADLVHDTQNTWLELSKEIINRNGFIEILQDITKADQYIDELDGCIFRTIDVHKLESTELDKAEIDEILNDINKKFKNKLENMFVRLGKLKTSMIEKKRIKVEYIETDIKNSVSDVIKEVEQKFLLDNIETGTSALPDKTSDFDDK